jgi:hypothetical protein
LPPRQTAFFAIETKPTKPAVDVSSTFQKNLKLPVHQWFRFSAGFSAQWVE